MPRKLKFCFRLFQVTHANWHLREPVATSQPCSAKMNHLFTHLRAANPLPITTAPPPKISDTRKPYLPPKVRLSLSIMYAVC